MRKWIIFFSAIAVAFTAQSISAAASDTEWDRTILPRPPQPFKGVTQRTLEGSVASFTQPVKAPTDAPNILLVLIDDAGFGSSSAFGGPCHTPNIEKLAATHLFGLGLPIHMADIGTDTFDQDFTLSLAENERQQLREIDQSLQRIADGTYGVCQMTGKPIPKARLDAKPWAKYTIEAARIAEGQWQG